MATPTELRKFGLLVGGVFLGLGALLLWRAAWGSVTGAVFVILGVGLGLFGLLVPRLLGPVQRAWMFLAHVLGWINTRLILAITFYGLFTLARLVTLLLRKDLMHRRPAPRLETYWVDLEAQESGESMEHQF